jgi:hypothetical protein
MGHADDQNQSIWHFLCGSGSRVADTISIHSRFLKSQKIGYDRVWSRDISHAI